MMPSAMTGAEDKHTEHTLSMSTMRLENLPKNM